MEDLWQTTTSSSSTTLGGCPVSDWTIALSVLTVLSWIMITILIIFMCRWKPTLLRETEFVLQNEGSFRLHANEVTYENAIPFQNLQSTVKVDERRTWRKNKHPELSLPSDIPPLALRRSFTSISSLATNESRLDYSLVPMDIKLKDLEFKGTLGRGAYGEVNLAVFTDVDGSKRQVAVKRLRDDVALRANEVENFLCEMKIVKTLMNSDHFVHFIGSSSTAGGNLFLVFQLEENGSLLDFLRSSRNLKTSTSTQLNSSAQDGRIGRNMTISKELITDFSIQVACGMTFLASAGIVHRDLAARNVLVSRDLTMKISDFGFAKRLEGSQEFYDGPGRKFPVKWMAPESLNKLIFSTMSDVWSFGVLLWELQTMGGRPYESVSEFNQLVFYLKSGRRLEQPMDCTKKFYGVMRRCWEYEPENRAEFDDILDHLEWIMKENYY